MTRMSVEIRSSHVYPHSQRDNNSPSVISLYFFIHILSFRCNKKSQDFVLYWVKWVRKIFLTYCVIFRRNTAGFFVGIVKKKKKKWKKDGRQRLKPKALRKPLFVLLSHHYSRKPSQVICMFVCFTLQHCNNPLYVCLFASFALQCYSKKPLRHLFVFL